MNSSHLKPYLRDGIDVYTDDTLENVTFVFLSSRKRIAIRCEHELTRLLPLCDGTRTLAELSESHEEARKVENFIAYLMSRNILVDAAWFERLRFADEYKQRLRKQLYFLMDLLPSAEEVENVQQRIMTTNVAIVGIGGVGSWIAVELAMMGFRKFVLVDYGVMSENSVARHAYFTQESRGAPKVEHYARVLKEIDPEIIVESRVATLNTTTDLDQIFGQADVIVNAADEPYIGYTSVSLSRYCVARDKLLYVAGGFDAHLGCLGELIVPGTTPCSDCYATYFREALKDWKPFRHPVADRTYGFGGLVSLSVFSASAACLSILRYMLEPQEGRKVSGGRGELKFTDYSIDYFQVEKDPNCRYCK